MGVADTADLGVEFLEHHGVKGMRWGVRTDRKGRDRFSTKDRSSGSDVAKLILLPVGLNVPAGVRLVKRHKEGAPARAKAKAAAQTAEADAKWEKSIYSTKGAVKVHNAVAKDLNAQHPAFNAKWEGKQPTKAYYKEYEGMAQKAYAKAVKDVHGSSPSGTKEARYVVEPDGSHKIIVATKKGTAAHAADPDLIIGVNVDANGKIQSLNGAEEGTAAHTADLGYEFLMHYGVKGMRWGVRKDKNTPSVFERNRDKHEEKLRTTRPAIKPRVQDTIGTSQRQKTKVSAKGGEDHPAAPDALKVAAVRQKLKKSGFNSLSNDELRDLATRANLEVQVKQLEGKRPKTLGKQITEHLLSDPVGTVEGGIKVGKFARAVSGR